MYYCEWSFLCTCLLVALPVSTVFQLASRDYKNGHFRGPDLLSLMDFEKHATWFLFPFISYITVNGVFYAPDCWYLCQCRLFFSWPAKIIKTNILEVLVGFFDGLPETFNMVFDLIQFLQYCEWGFLCTCSLVALPVSTVFQLASQDCKNGYFRGPDLLFLMDFVRLPT